MLDASSGRTALVFYQQGPNTRLAGNRRVVCECLLQRAFLLGQRVDGWTVSPSRRNRDSIDPLQCSSRSKRMVQVSYSIDFMVVDDGHVAALYAHAW